MSAKLALRMFARMAAVTLVLWAADASAQCASCGTAAPAYSVGYAAPVAYQAAYAPTYTTAYAPAYTTAYAPAYTTYSSGWYPGYWLGRVNRSIWGYPTTTYYAPAYTASYAPVAYAPTTVSYAPACSTCSASYAAPACSSCSTCVASYAPACSSCTSCDACAAGASTCASCAGGATVSQAVYQEPAAAAPSSTTYSTQGTTTTSSTEQQPTLAPSENPPAERTLREADKPLPAEPPTLQPEPKSDATDGKATNLQAPQLFDPRDHTAQRHMAPVWTAVYLKTKGSPSTIQPVAWQQAERDAEGWSSVAE